MVSPHRLHVPASRIKTKPIDNLCTKWHQNNTYTCENKIQQVRCHMIIEDRVKCEETNVAKDYWKHTMTLIELMRTQTHIVNVLVPSLQWLDSIHVPSCCIEGEVCRCFKIPEHIQGQIVWSKRILQVENIQTSKTQIFNCNQCVLIYMYI